MSTNAELGYCPCRCTCGPDCDHLRCTCADCLLDLTRDQAIKRIRTALRKRSGKAWSVTGGRGTAWGWIKIDAPPARRTWTWAPKAGSLGVNPGDFEEVDSGEPGPGKHTGPAERAELATLLDLERIHHQGHSIPASSDYYREHVDRAEGRAPSVIGRPYWD